MSSQSALYSLCRLRSLALAGALPLAGCYATPSLDNPRFENGPDGQDLRSLVCADDAVETSDGGCDQDKDGDGIGASDDCDEDDPNLLNRAQDGDCDGAPTADDCDDADPNVLSRAQDGDCDGAPTADDCNDADPNSLTRGLDRNCVGDGQIRLVNGTARSGRVEISFSRAFGTVCDDVFGVAAAQVVCRQLGFSGGSPVDRSIFGSGTGPIQLDGFTCSGTEGRLVECSNIRVGVNDCQHSEDVGVTCQ